jgi:hypothetical protein
LLLGCFRQGNPILPPAPPPNKVKKMQGARDPLQEFAKVLAFTMYFCVLG